MDHPFGDDGDRTFQLGETCQYYIGDHPSVCAPPPPLLLPAATAGSHWPPPLGVEGGADPTAGSNNSSSQEGHVMMMAAKDPAARRSRGASNNKRTSRGGVKLSTDPQSVAARQRRHRISDRFKILKSLVPGGSKMDTVSMLEEAINYVKFLKAQIWLHQAALMLHPEEHICRTPPPISLPPMTNNAMPSASASTNISVAGNYDYASSFSSTCCLALPSDRQHMYAMEAPGDEQRQSVVFPCSTFHEEEEIFRHGSLNY